MQHLKFQYTYSMFVISHNYLIYEPAPACRLQVYGEDQHWDWYGYRTLRSQYSCKAQALPLCIWNWSFIMFIDCQQFQTRSSGRLWMCFPLGCQSPAALRPHIIKMLFAAPAGQTFVVTRLHRALRKYCPKQIPIGNEQCETQRSACPLLCERFCCMQKPSRLRTCRLSWKLKKIICKETVQKNLGKQLSRWKVFSQIIFAETVRTEQNWTKVPRCRCNPHLPDAGSQI